MTLILFIPHCEGCILLSDRQSTLESGYKNEVTKLHVQGVKGPAIGSSGNTRVIQNLYDKIRDRWEEEQGNSCYKIIVFCKEILADVQEIRRFTNMRVNPTLEMLIVEAGGENITPFCLKGFLPARIDVTHIGAVPEDISEVQRYLRIDTTKFSEDEAILLGEEILRQVAFSNYEVGPPEYHGYDYVKISTDGIFILEHKKETLQRLEPSELLKKVRFEEESSG